jgi:hypothetical protein
MELPVYFPEEGAMQYSVLLGTTYVFSVNEAIAQNSNTFQELQVVNMKELAEEENKCRCRRQWCGSVTFWYGSGSADPCLTNRSESGS